MELRNAELIQIHLLLISKCQLVPKLFSIFCCQDSLIGFYSDGIKQRLLSRKTLTTVEMTISRDLAKKEASTLTISAVNKDYSKRQLPIIINKIKHLFLSKRRERTTSKVIMYWCVSVITKRVNYVKLCCYEDYEYIFRKRKGYLEKVCRYKYPIKHLG